MQVSSGSEMLDMKCRFWLYVKANKDIKHVNFIKFQYVFEIWSVRVHCVILFYSWPTRHVWLNSVTVRAEPSVGGAYKDHISSDSTRPHNDTVGKAIMPGLTSAQRNTATGRLHAGITQHAMSRCFGVSKQTISAIWTWYITRSVNGRPGSGRRRMIDTSSVSSSKSTTTATTTVKRITGQCRMFLPDNSYLVQRGE